MEELLKWLGENADALGVVGATVGGIAAAVAWLIKYRQNSSAGTVSGSTHIDVGDNVRNSGIIAGGSVTVGAFISKDTDEIVNILNRRAQTINNNLLGYFEYAQVNKYLSEFNILHQMHVKALRENNFVLAHEILNEIHDLSNKLESDEFWTRHKKETPGVKYSLMPGAFTRGPMICGYVVGDLTRYSKLYPRDNPSAPLEEGRLRPRELYELILSTDARL